MNAGVSPQKEVARFRLMVGEPWDFAGPDGENRVDVTVAGVVEGPEKPNWQKTHLLLTVLSPFSFHGEFVKQMVAAPRYVGSTARGISWLGGHVGVCRVKADVTLRPGERFQSSQVEYIIIGNMKRDYGSFFSWFKDAAG